MYFVCNLIIYSYIQKDKNKDKEHHDGETTASETNSPCDAYQDSRRDHSHDREARDAALAQTIAEAVAREMAKAHAHYQAILKERGTATLQTSLKVSSGANGFKVMDPFDWTKDKSIYQRWQLWSEKARLTLDAMEGDSEKTKISYFHIGSMEREWDTLSHGKTARPSLANLHMTRSVSLFQTVVSHAFPSLMLIG